MIGRTNAVSGGAGFGHTVDFISDGENYARYMVTDGQSVGAPSPDPTKEGLHFSGWRDEDENEITFPYTPSGDITLTAHFVLTREGMVLTEAGKIVCHLWNTIYSKTYAGWAIAGYVFLGDSTYPVLVAPSAVATEITSKWGSLGTEGSFVYRGVTYYYSGKGRDYGVAGNETSTNTDVTDLYKCTESTMEAAALTLVKRYLYEI
jgi:uncharacterized repeat protein (TIGR02543 family)